MGTDKASLVVDGLAMADRVVAAVEQAGILTVVVAGGDHVADAIPHAGPLAGIVGGWRHLRAQAIEARLPPFDPVVVLSCDLPALTALVVERLLRTSTAHKHGALAHDGERPQPLVAAYRPEALEAFEVAFEAGVRSPRRCFEGWDLGEINVDADVVADADRPSDLTGFDVQWPL